jgi:bis(5'-nucleosyl)-tetraphosphatase (symmetrical)
MRFLIGDVQGCDAALGRLLDEIGFSPSRDSLVLLGDLVNRGPQSLRVLERVSTLGASARCLLGNHDLHLLAVAHGVRAAHRSDTLQDILASPQRARWLDWLRAQPLALRESGGLCVHAGVLPAWDAERVLQLAAEVEMVLRGDGLRGFLPQMYGNEPATWSDGHQGPARWRCVINALTRLRFCTADGAMEFRTKEGAGAAPPGYLPWFEVPGRRTAGEPIACGHWSTLGLVNRPDLLALDTGCVWGGSLTAVRVDGGRRDVMQVACAAAAIPGA